MEYKRRTERYIDEEGHKCVRKLAWDGEILHTLAELEDKIENKTLIELPCKVGDMVYFVNDYRPTPRIEEYVVYGIMLDGSEVILHIDFMETINAKNVYFTKSEAEQKLKALKGE